MAKRGAAFSTVISAVLFTSAALAPATASPAVLQPPVDAPIAASFVAPEVDWGPGHRGVDYRVPAGTQVRAAAAGAVSFAGMVAGTQAVTVDHGDGLASTYSSLSEIHVRAGDRVGAGAWIGRSGVAHEGGVEGLHFGVKVGGSYVDPLSWLAPIDPTGAIHLVEDVGWPSEAVPEVLRPSSDRAGNNKVPCARGPRPAAGQLTAPNDNIAVAVAGISSSTMSDPPSAGIYEYGPELLGYAPEHVYRFSYRGTDGPRFHERYPASATYGDIVVAAGRLALLMEAIARKHPGAEVDLIAHSQGGIVSRVYLEHYARPWDPRLPRVEHLVTFASPHLGAPAAALTPALDETASGPALLDGLSGLSRSGALPMPDPRSAATAQLAPGSSLIRWLASEDLSFGTKALALSIPDDVVVPADHALFPGEVSRTVAPAFGWAHGAIVSHPEARDLAHGFLRAAATPCPGLWDRWGPRAGWLVSHLTGRVPVVYRALEAGPLAAIFGF
ncbi:MAG TPA: peptidoglycan DD-metalloendopeptidase family protein [Actinomycetota bacterium]|nr:peptidoglycan DD-metalloendopeptidase family protein [Actinomycetota bacterium]